MKIAVVGAGIFGSTTAIILARNGFDVTLYEKEGDVLQAASGINQYRLHRGYHYPRSKETALSAKLAEKPFLSEYEDCIVQKSKHYYAIAKNDTKTSADDLLRFCNDCNLEYKVTSLPVLNNDNLQLVVEVKESLIDPEKIKSKVNKNISDSGVKLLLNTFFKEDDINEYDFVINATYAGMNNLNKEKPLNYQFELCEKPVIKLSDKFKDISVVILDGPFTCIDPLGDTGYHVIGNVVHAIHSTEDGTSYDIPKDFESMLNKGIINNPKITNINKFIDTAKIFIPEIVDFSHIGSMYTVRTVLPDVHLTDERLTHVYWYNNKIINIFSGKIGNSVSAAYDVLKLLKSI